jgi:hypothetical protein
MIWFYIYCIIFFHLSLFLDKFLKYEELTLWLSLLAKTYPSLITISSIGKSHENRDIWLATITDNSSGDHSTKPAHWVDG